MERTGKMGWAWNKAIATLILLIVASTAVPTLAEDAGWWTYLELPDFPKKVLFLFSVQERVDQIVRTLNSGTIPDALGDAFSANDITLSDRAKVEVVKPNEEWRITDQGRVFIVRLEDGTLNIYEVWWMGNFDKQCFLVLAGKEYGTFYEITLSQIGNGTFYPGFSCSDGLSSLDKGVEFGIREGPGLRPDEVTVVTKDVYISRDVDVYISSSVRKSQETIWVLVFDRESSMLWKASKSEPRPLNWDLFESAQKMWEKSLDLLEFPNIVAIAVADLVGKDGIDDLIVGAKGEDANYLYLLPGGGSNNFLTPKILEEDLTRRKVFATTGVKFPTILDWKFTDLVLETYEAEKAEELSGELNKGKVPDRLWRDLAEEGVSLYKPFVVSCPEKEDYPEFLKRWYDAGAQDKEYWIITDAKGSEYVVMADYKITENLERVDILRVFRKPVFDLIFVHELKIHTYPVDPFIGRLLPTMILVKDVTGDGWKDIVVAERHTAYRSGGILVLANKGYGAFEKVWEAGIFEFERLSKDSPRLIMCMGDFDGDGKGDLALAGNYDLAFLKGDGKGHFEVVQIQKNKINNPIQIMAWKEAVVVLNENNVSIWKKASSGDFKEVSSTLPVAATSIAMDIVDLNGDGLEDLVVLNDKPGVSAYLNRAGEFLTHPWRPRGRLAAMATLDRNGLDSLAIAQVPSERKRDFEIRKIKGETVLVGSGLPTDAYPGTILFLKDIDPRSDRPETLIMSNFGKNFLSWLSPQKGEFGKGRWEKVPIKEVSNKDIKESDIAPRGIACFSPNSEEKYLAILDYKKGKLFIANIEEKYGKINLVVKKWEEWTFDVGHQPIAVVTGKFHKDDPNGSGIAVLSQGDETVTIYRKSWAYLGPEYEKIPPLEEVGTYKVGGLPVAMAAGELNGDGVTDLVVANYADNSVTILLSQEDGTFKPETRSTGGIGPIAVAIGPFANLYGGEGPYNDIIVAHYVSSDISILKNTGEGFTIVSFQSENLKGALWKLVDEEGVTHLVKWADFKTKKVKIKEDEEEREVYLLEVPYGPVALITGEFTAKGQVDLIVGVEYPEEAGLGLFLVGPTSVKVKEDTSAEPTNWTVLNVVGLKFAGLTVSPFEIGFIMADRLQIKQGEEEKNGLELHLYRGKYEQGELTVNESLSVYKKRFPVDQQITLPLVTAADIDRDDNTDLVILDPNDKTLSVSWGPKFSVSWSPKSAADELSSYSWGTSASLLLAWPGHVLVDREIWSWEARDGPKAKYTLDFKGIPEKAAVYPSENGVAWLAVATRSNEGKAELFAFRVTERGPISIWDKSLMGTVEDLTWLPDPSGQTPSLVVAWSNPERVVFLEGGDGREVSKINLAAVAVEAVIDGGRGSVLALTNKGALYFLYKRSGDEEWDVHFIPVRLTMESDSLRVFDLNNDNHTDVVVFKRGGSYVHIVYNSRRGPDTPIELFRKVEGKRRKLIAVVFQEVFNLYELLCGSTTRPPSPLSQLTLKIQIEGKGSVTIDGEPVMEKKVAKGTEVELDAIPQPGWEFEEWKGIGKNRKIFVTVDTDLVLTAVFKQKKLPCNPLSLDVGAWPPPENGAHILSASTVNSDALILVKGWTLALFSRAERAERPLKLECALTLDSEVSELAVMRDEMGEGWALLSGSKILFVERFGESKINVCEIQLPLFGETIAAGDFLGYGKDQLAVSYIGSNRLDILIHVQDGFSLRTYMLTFPLSRMKAADINADGQQELVVLGEEAVYVLSFQESSGEPNVCSVSLGRSVSNADLLIGDLDGDKCSDVLIIFGEEVTCSVWGISLFSKRDRYLVPQRDFVINQGWGWKKAVLVDTMRDGTADHLMIITERWPLALLYPLEGGKIASIPPLALVAAPSPGVTPDDLDPQDAMVVDLDGDTRIDILLITKLGRAYVAWGKEIWTERSEGTYVELKDTAWEGDRS